MGWMRFSTYENDTSGAISFGECYGACDQSSFMVNRAAFPLEYIGSSIPCAMDLIINRIGLYLHEEDLDHR